MGFFDKLKEQASILGAQLDQTLDTTKQKTQIASLRKQRTELVTQLGEALLNQFRQEQVNPEALRPQVDQVFSLEWQIIDLEKQVEAQRQAASQAKAPVAASQIPTQVATPPAAAPAPPQPAAQAGPVACPSCGVEVPVGSAFCPNCGSRLGG